MLDVNAAPPGGDVDRGAEARILFWVTAGIAFIVVALRFLGRRMRQSLGGDDWTMLVTLVSLDAASYCFFLIILKAHVGVGIVHHLCGHFDEINQHWRHAPSVLSVTR